MIRRLFECLDKRNHNGAANGGAAAAPSDYLINMRGVIKEFPTPAGVFRALNGVDLKVGRGEFVAVVGKSGSGKSTLMNMFTGIDRPDAGDVIVAGTAVQKLSESQMAIWRGKNLGIIFQFFQLLPTLSVIENVMLPMDLANVIPAREREARAMSLLEQVDMAEEAHKLPSALSGGQQQKVAIARALANDPPLIAADEPTGNLDSKSAEAIFKLFERLVAQGKTILMVTHDRDLARRVARTVIIADGEVVSDQRNDMAAQPAVGIPEREAVSQGVGADSDPRIRVPMDRERRPRRAVPVLPPTRSRPAREPAHA